MLWMTKIYKNPIEVDNIALFAGVNPSFECLFPTMCWLSPQCWLVTLHVCSIVVHLLLNPSHHHHHSLSLSLAKTCVFLEKNDIEPAYFMGQNRLFFWKITRFFWKIWCFLGPSHPWTPWLRLRPMLPPPSCERSGFQPPAGHWNRDARRGNMGKKATNYGDFNGF